MRIRLLGTVVAVALLAGSGPAAAQERPEPREGLRTPPTSSADREPTGRPASSAPASEPRLRAAEPVPPAADPNDAPPTSPARVSVSETGNPLTSPPGWMLWVVEGTALLGLAVGTAGLLALRRRRNDDMAAAALRANEQPLTPEQVLEAISRLFHEQRAELQRVSERLRRLEEREAHPSARVADTALVRPEPAPSRVAARSNEYARSDRIAAGVRQLLADYEMLVRDRNKTAFTAGRAIEGLRGVGQAPASFEAGMSIDNAPLWAVAVEDVWIALPGWAAVRRWDLNYRVASGNAAREQFGGAYDLQGGETQLRVIRPAFLERSGDGYRVIERGVLAGVP